MKKIRKYISCITKAQCEAYRVASISVQPLNKPICRELNTHQVVKVGSGAMRDDGFVLARGIKNV